MPLLVKPIDEKLRSPARARELSLLGVARGSWGPGLPWAESFGPQTRLYLALFYTGVIGAGGLAPIAYGVIADHSNRTVGIVAAALTAAVTIPLILALRPILQNERSLSAEQQE